MQVSIEISNIRMLYQLVLFIE